MAVIAGGTFPDPSSFTKLDGDSQTYETGTATLAESFFSSFHSFFQSLGRILLGAETYGPIADVSASDETNGEEAIEEEGNQSHFTHFCNVWKQVFRTMQEAILPFEIHEVEAETSDTELAETADETSSREADLHNEETAWNDRAVTWYKRAASLQSQFFSALFGVEDAASVAESSDSF